jgi:hypothetical protein
MSGHVVGTPLYPDRVRNRSAFRGVPVAGTAAAGVLLGHWLAYTVAFPAAVERDHVLAESGHSYWLTAVRFAVVLAVAGLAVVVRRLVCANRSGQADEGFAPLARRLAGVQIAAFVAMELIERLVTGAPLTHMLDHQVFFLGLAAQVVVACAGALVLRWFGCATVAVVRTLRREVALLPSARTPDFRPRPALGRPLPALAGAAGVRGPPPR